MDLLTANDELGRYPQSYYAAHAEPLPICAKATGAISCDVCVIGGGFTGLSAALHLAQRGYSVRLLEAQRLGFGASGRNGGQVGQGHRLDQQELEALVGREHAHALWQIGRQSVELVRDLCALAPVRTEFQAGIIHAAHRKRYVPDMRDYVEFMHRDYGYDDIALLDQEAMRARVASPAYYGGTIDYRSGHIDPLEFALGLARLAQEAGAILHEGSRVTAITPQAKGSQIITQEATVSANYVVLACNGYLGSLNRDVAAKILPINNFIVATEPLPDIQEQIIQGNVAVADSKFVVNYFRFSPDHRLLFGGSESYGYKFPTNIEAKVRKPMTEIFPQLRDVKIDYAWGGTLGITMNRMPHFERINGYTLSLSGFSGHGVAMGTLAGQIAAETIAGQAERFDVMQSVPTPNFPGGTLLRYPLLVLAMLWFSLRDRL